MNNKIIEIPDIYHQVMLEWQREQHVKAIQQAQNAYPHSYYLNQNA